MIETLAHVTSYEFPTLLLAFAAGLAAGVAGTLATMVARRR